MPNFNNIGYGVAANPGGTSLPSLSSVRINGVDYGLATGGFSGSYDDLTDKPTIPTDNASLSNGAGYITSYTDTNTQLSDADIAAFGYIKTDTNTQLSDADIAAFGYIKTDTNTQRTDAEIDARIALNPEGFITSYTDTNTQLSDSDIAAFGYIKTDTNTQLSDSDIAAFGYIKTDTNTQLSDSDIAAFGYIKTDTNTQRTDAEIDARIALNPEGFVTTDTNTQLSDSDIAAFGYIKTDTNTQLSDSDIAALGYIKTDTNTQLSDSDIAAFGYIKTDTNTQLSDSDISTLGYVKQTAVDAATVSIATASGAVNFNSGVNHHLTVSGAWTLSLSNISGNEGQSGVIVITNSAATSTPTMPTEFKTPNGDTAVWNNASGNTAMLSYYIVNSTTILTNYIGNFS